jgi:hypothetical protein
VESTGKESGLVMHHWLPVQLIDRNQTVIKKEDVLTTFIPNKEFSEYYESTIERMERLLKVKKEVDPISNERYQKLWKIYMMVRIKPLINISLKGGHTR